MGFGQSRRPSQLPVLTMVLGYSRWLSALLIPSRRAEDMFAGWWRLVAAIGAAPRVFVCDGEGAVGRRRGGRAELTGQCQAFRGTLGAKVIVCKPADPEAKGLIERAHDYLERSFLPGRSFDSPSDFNTQLQHWLGVVNTRIRRALGCAPTDRISADRQAMIALPPVPPATGWRSSVRLPRDHYVRLDSNDYSVHPGVIGRRTVADHERAWAWHQTISDPEHVAAAEAMRHHRVTVVPTTELEVEQRRLGYYDDTLGIDVDGHVDGGVA